MSIGVEGGAVAAATARLLAGAATLLILHDGAHAQGVAGSATTPAVTRGPGAVGGAPAAGAEAGAAALDEVVVQARRAEAARAAILPGLGAREYAVDRETIEALPGGANLSLNGVLLQTPGVVQDSFGEVHVRGEHRNLQFRLNGVFLPESLTGFGQVFETRSLRSVSVLTGALPAQYGFRTNAVIDLRTRTGATDPGGEVGVYGGSFGTIQPHAAWAGFVGGVDVFATGTFLRSERGIENPTASRTVPNNETQQTRGLLSASGQLDPQTRLTVIAGTSLNRFEIPATTGVQPSFGDPELDALGLRSRQWERTWFGVAALQRSFGPVEVQTALSARYSSIHYTPDVVRELAFSGVASDVFRGSEAYTSQTDASWRIGRDHTLRFGVQATVERARFRSDTSVFPTDEDGEIAGDSFALADRTSRTGYLLGGYVQDEWRVTDRLTVNLGARWDQMVEYVTAGQVSPRINVVWRPLDGTTLHAGYARTFTPPQFELVATGTLDRFVGTTNAPESLRNDPARPERANRFDAGVSQRLGDLTLGVDAYYKDVRDLLDFGQFGNALIFTPFNYREGRVYGVEFTGTYRLPDLLLYANLAVSRSVGRDIRSAQFNIEADELDYISRKFVRTDHDQLLTGSAGAVYRAWTGGTVSASLLYGNGLRAGFANSEKLPNYVTANFGVRQEFRFVDGGTWTARADLLNAFDSRYQLRDGSGIGVGAPQYGARRGVFFGLSRAF